MITYNSQLIDKMSSRWISESSSSSSSSSSSLYSQALPTSASSTVRSFVPAMKTTIDAFQKEDKPSPITDIFYCGVHNCLVQSIIHTSDGHVGKEHEPYTKTKMYQPECERCPLPQYQCLRIGDAKGILMDARMAWKNENAKTGPEVRTPRYLEKERQLWVYYAQLAFECGESRRLAMLHSGDKPKGLDDPLFIDDPELSLFHEHYESRGGEETSFRVVCPVHTENTGDFVPYRGARSYKAECYCCSRRTPQRFKQQFRETVPNEKMLSPADF